MIPLLVSLLSPAQAEGTAQLGNQRLHPSTALRVDLLSASESFTWRGRYPIQVFAPGVSPESGTALGTFNSGATIPASAGPGTYSVKLTGPQVSGQEPGFEVDWDITVPGATGGRVWSRAWQLDAGSFTEDKKFDGSFYAKVDAGDPSVQSVVELRAAGLAGFIWFMAANESGVAGTNGRSFDWPNASGSGGPTVQVKFPLYLNPPELATYSHVTPTVTGASFDYDATTCDAVSAGLTGGVFRFETPLDATWHIVCDTSGDGNFDITTDDDVHLLVAGPNDPRVRSEAGADVREVEWDGTNNAGDPVLAGTYSCQVRVTVAEFHYVASDVETSYPGFRLFEVDASGAREGLPMFWNDAEVAYRNDTMPNGSLGLDNSGPNGLSAGSPGGPALPNTNARAWGRFTATSKGDRAFLDTYTFVADATSTLFQVRVLDADGDRDGDTLGDAEEQCVFGTDPTLADTDGDGLDDDVEVGSLPTDPTLADTDGDGLDDGEEVGNPALPRNTDRDGLIDAVDPDDDGDGVPTAVEDVNDDGDPRNDDTDDDDDPNYLDPDDDGDGAETRDEDHDEDGQPANDDTDLDDVPDYLDPDDDGDGVDTVDEDRNGNGTPADDRTDSDDLPDYLDPDDDGDGVPTLDEDVDGNGDPRDDFTDDDPLPDYLDGDDDGDGIPTSIEGAGFTDDDDLPDHRDTDADGDGLDDEIEGVVDTDDDDHPDFQDADDDNDGVPSSTEWPRGDTDGDDVDDHLDPDDDNDGIDTIVEGDADPDHDETPAYLDDDSDGDGLSDELEGAVDTDDDGDGDFLDTDSDGDTRPDAQEGIADTDGDLRLDFQDDDDDGDSVPSRDEPGDTDDDGTDDALDTDDDGDGIPTATEASWTAPDADGDGTPNHRDLDSDDDGVEDAVEGTADIDLDDVPDYVDPDGAYGTYYVGGCTLDQRGGAPVGLAAVAVALIAARRRRCA
jgi:hypothetical protein